MRARAFSAVACAALLIGCAHGPGASLSGPPEVAPPADTLTEATPPEPQDEGLAPAPDALANADEDAADFADLLARMRAGFALPPADEPAVRRDIDWYRRHPAYLERVLGRGKRYLHHIVEALDSRDMPLELALLPAIESAFNPFAHSRRGASGLWQFLPSTGRHYDLDGNWWYDDRRDVIEATRAAADYLGDLHTEFDDWLLAVAAYNAGAGNVRRAITRNRRRGRPTDFFHLDLPRETRSYVPRLLALARVVADPEAYGVELPTLPNTPYFARVELDDQVDLGLLADLADVPRKELRALNPQFKRWATAPASDGGPDRLLVPAAHKERFEEVLSELPPDKRLRLVHHRVRRGDSLYSIARRNGISVHALRGVNGIHGSLIRAGQDLLVPLPH